MKLKYRRIIAKNKAIQTIARVIMYNSGYFFYKRIYRKNNYKEFFSKICNSKKNQRCFIIGNGPSLCASDLDKLVNEDCFASNEIYKIFGRTNWRPKYFLIIDRYSKTSGEVIDGLPIEHIFLGDYYLRYHKVKREDIVCLHEHYCLFNKRMKFSEDISKYLVNCATVSYGLMQIIAYMGYSEIYLLGFDHTYALEFDRKGRVITTEKNTSHFFQDEIPNDIIADIYGMTRAYETFNDYCKNKGITVKNATRGGNLRVFDRVEFDSLF